MVSQVGIAAWLIVFTVAGALILRVAVATYNFVVGGRASSEAVPDLPVLSAVHICMITAFVGGMLGLWTYDLMGILHRAKWSSLTPLHPALLSFVASMIVLVGVLKILLPTTFPRAFMVALFHTFICIVVAGAFVSLFLATAKVTGPWQ